MARLKVILFAALIAGFLFAQTALAQVISVAAGNGQMICTLCTTAPFQFFDPIVAKVADANGNPLANQTVTWAVTSGNGTIGSTSTVTDAAGLSSNTYFLNFNSPGNVFMPFQQSTITASSGFTTTTFTLTQALVGSINGVLLVQTYLNSPAIGEVLSGASGTQGTTPVQVQLLPAVPGVAVSLLGVKSDGTETGVQDPSKGPTIQCASGAGAGPNTVLTGADGLATCTPVFGGKPGTSRYFVLVGGVPAGINNGGSPIGFADYGPLPFTVTAGAPGSIQIISGNNQSVNPGQSASAPLVATVADTAGNPMSGQPVTWTVNPSTSGTLSSQVATSDATGRVSTNLAVASSAAGSLQVKVALTSNASIFATFNVLVNVQITALQKLSGDNQSAAVNTAFGQPLVVQVNGSTGRPVSGYPVQFTVNGPASLSASVASTDGDGRSQVAVQAGATTGAVTVTAVAGSFSQTFTLTSRNAGPTLTSTNVLNGAGFYNTYDSSHAALSPCAVATIRGGGIAPGINGVVVPGMDLGNPALFGKLPYTLASVQVSFNNGQAPIYSVLNWKGQEAVTVQVPCDVTPGDSVPMTVSVGGGSATINVPVRLASPGIFESAMSDGVIRVVATRADGSFVTLENPARKGEIVRFYMTGLGAVSPSIATNQLPNSGVDSIVASTLIAGVNNAGVRVVSARYSPELIGVYEVSIQLPSDVTAGNDVPLALAVVPQDNSTTLYSNTSKLPIQ